MRGITFIEQYFILFMIYAVGGWIMEEIHCSISEKKIVNRGFLIGPVCPIYGFGGMLITLFLTIFKSHPVAVFFIGMLLCAVLEYFTSLIMEKIFNARWWDYSDQKLNLNGRICIETLIPFGIFGLVVIYLLNPFLLKYISKIPPIVLLFVSLTILIIFVTDILISFKTVSKITATAQKISKENVKDNTNEITKKMKEELKDSYNVNRLTKAFPNLKTFKIKVKEVAKKTAQKGKEVARKTAEKGKEVAKKTMEKGKKMLQ